MEPSRLSAAIASAQSGLSIGFEELSDAFAPRLYGYFLRATGNHHDAEDLLGEMMLRLVRQLNKYDERGRFEPWLFRVAANLVRDRIRRKKSKPLRLTLSIEDDSGKSMAESIEGKPFDASDGMVHEELSDRLTRAMEKLDDVTRQMILLRHFSQMSFKEVAKLFGCPIGTALAKVHRGLATLRGLMGDE